MSGQMWGADVEELERIAREFRKSADDIDGQGRALTGALNRVAWLGEVATAFFHDWTGVSVPKIGMSTSFLRDAASNLEKQARQQRDASDTFAGVGGTSAGGGGTSRPPLTPEQQQELNQLSEQARDQAGRTPAEQAEWWNSLTDEQRALLMAESPGLVMGMGGLPPDVRSQAAEQYLANQAGKIVVSTDHYELGGSVNVPLFGTKIGIGLQVAADKTVYADGSVDVQLSGAPLAGMGVVGASASGGPMGTLTYHFDSQAEADAFLKKVGIAAGAASLSPVGGGAALAVVLATNADHLQSGGAGTTAGGYAHYGPASGSVDQSTVVSVDRGGNTTLTASGSVTGKAAWNTLMNTAQGGNPPLSTGPGVMWGDQDVVGASGSASLTLGSDGTPKTITLTGTTMTGESSGLHGVEYGTQTNGSGTTTTIELDLSDPVLAGHANEIADAVQRGDVDSVMQQLDQLGASDVIDRATVTTTTFDTSSTEGGFDIYIATGSGEMSGTTATSVTVKPPGGEAQVVMGG